MKMQHDKRLFPEAAEPLDESSDEIDQVTSKDVSFLLTQLEVFNWGPFRGLHRAEFDSHGTAIIGPTGSGKTTLVDALMTLIVHNPRYNLASTGGHESDRTLIEYVRGVLGGDATHGRPDVARPGKTISGICATYRGGNQTVRLAGLLWTEGSGNAADDLKRRWIFSLADDQTLEGWIRLLHEEGIRELLKTGRETANLRIFESKKAYLERTRTFFDVGENAFTLLNRAAGLKQLNSVDEIFRELVLDDRSAFERALEVAGEFDNLSEIHAELETARRQVESLVPIEEQNGNLIQTKARLQETEVLKQIIPIYFAILAEEKWKLRLHDLTVEKNKLQEQLNGIHAERGSCEARVDALRERYLELGGNVIGELERTIDAQKKLADRRTKDANNYRSVARLFKLRDDLTWEGLTVNQAELRSKNGELKEQRARHKEQTLDAMSRQRELERHVTDKESSIHKVGERPGTNIPLHFQDFRAELANVLSLNGRDIPFLAELVEVQANHADWRGAIERAIGSTRLCILVPDSQINVALDWVNHRDNRLHVRLQRANQNDQPASFFADSYLNKLNFKPHPLLTTAKRLLSSRDLHCVNSAAALKSTDHGLTREGMISGKQGRFEKQDQRRLTEDWMTGFDNKDQLDLLIRQFTELRKQCDISKQDVEEMRSRLEELEQRLTMIEQLLGLEFSTIDLIGAEADLKESQDRLDSLLNPSSDASQAKKEYDHAKQRLEEIQERIREIEKKIAVEDERCTRAEKEIVKARSRALTGLTEDQQFIATRSLAIPAGCSPEDLIDHEHNLFTVIDKKLSNQTNRVSEIEKTLVRLMGIAKREDTGALTDVGSQIEDIPVYLERLRVLREEALPEKRKRFLEYLNRSSDQGVTQLISSINEEVDAIEQRIKELNLTLIKVDFREGRFLQLEPSRIQDERLRSLDAAVRKVRSAALKDDGGESHFKALQEMVSILREAGQTKHKQGSKALLDPRFRLAFFVVEIDRQTGVRSLRRTGSQSGSGGEKELMASHVLTASLSYALCPAEASRPLYATVVLDEAFSKSSPSAASRIIEALRIFCLHPIFVTPNKEIGLLKRHTRKVICVHRPQREASLACISWETLEQLSRQQ